MPSYSRNVIEEIKNRLRLSDVVGSYVSLTRQGRSDDYKACCPFHNERTPSFYVHDDKGFYKCFGCQKSGNIFTFIMEMEHVGFPESVALLAEKAGVELRQESPQEKARADKRDTLQDLYNRICKSYHYIFRTDDRAGLAREYVADRGITTETADIFALGFAYDDPAWLLGFLKRHNYSRELLAECGLFSKRNPDHPLFRNRILFPVRDWRGNCVAFSGRDLTGASPAKYVNSPETELYSKRHNLFGIYESLPTLKKDRRIIICEGNFDVISLHQAGVTCAAAPLGTALTAEQIRLIKRYCNRASLLFDTDEPGRAATVKALTLCQQNGLECDVVKPFETAKDASEVLQREGAESLKEYTERTETAISFLVENAMRTPEAKTPRGKMQALKEISPFLDATHSRVERGEYLKFISQSLGIREEEIRLDYAQNANVPKISSDSAGQEDRIADAVGKIETTPELYAMLLMLRNRQHFNDLRNYIHYTDLDDENAKQIFTVLENAYRDSSVSVETELSGIKNEVLRNYIFGYLEENRDSQDSEEELNSAIKSLRIKKLIKKRDLMQNLIGNVGNFESDGDGWRELLESKENLDREIEALRHGEE